MNTTSFDYEKLHTNSWLLFLSLGKVRKPISEIYFSIKNQNIKDKCREVSRHLCDKINEIEPNSTIVICCKGFWRNEKFSEDDLYAFKSHQFLLYQNKYFIDLTLTQFDIDLPSIFITTVEQGHIGQQKYIHQTYPEIVDLNYKNTLNL